MKRLLGCTLLLVCLALFSSPSHAQDAPEISHIGRGVIRSVEWHAGGDYLLVSTITGAWLYTPDLKDLHHIEGIQLATFSPDGKYIAGVDADSRIRLWDAKTFEPIDSPELSAFERITALVWSPDGRYLALSWKDNQYLGVDIWDFDNDMARQFLYGNGNRLLWSPHGKYLAVGDSQTVSVFDTTPESHNAIWTKPALGFTWQNDSSILTTAGQEQFDLALWDITTDEQIRQWTSYDPSFLYNHSGTLLANAGNGNLSLYDAETDEKHFTIGTGADLAGPNTFRWSHNDHWIATGMGLHLAVVPTNLGIMDAQTGKIVHQFSGLLQWVSIIIWSDDDHRVAIVDARGQLAVYDIETLETLGISQSHVLIGATVAWNSSGSEIAVADQLNRVTIWNSETLQPQKMFPALKNPVVQIGWQPSGSLIAMLSQEGFMTPTAFNVWDTASEDHPDVTSRFPFATTRPITLFSWSRDGKQLAAIGGANLYIWDAQTRYLTARQADVNSYGAISTLDWSPSSQFLAIASTYQSYPQAYVFDVHNRHLTESPALRTWALSAWRRDSELIQFRWKTWDDQPWREPHLRHIAQPENPQAGDYDLNAGIHLIGLALAAQQGFLSSRGTYAAAIDQNGSGIIWDTATAKPLTMLANVAQMLWSPDETQLLVQRTDGSLWLLDGDGTIEQQLPRPSGLVETNGQFFWSPDGGKLAYLHNGVVDLWRLGA